MQQPGTTGSPISPRASTTVTDLALVLQPQHTLASSTPRHYEETHIQKALRQPVSPFPELRKRPVPRTSIRQPSASRRSNGEDIDSMTIELAELRSMVNALAKQVADNEGKANRACTRVMRVMRATKACKSCACACTRARALTSACVCSAGGSRLSRTSRWVREFKPTTLAIEDVRR